MMAIFDGIENQCKECTEPTKYPCGCWDGMNEDGNWISGFILDCDNMACPVKQAREAENIKAEQKRCCVKIQNKENGVDIDLIREQSRKNGITVYKMSQILGLRPSEWCDRIYCRVPMEPGTAIRAMDAILKARERADIISREDVYNMLNELGGCDAQEDYFKGWDAAIDGAISGLQKIKGVNK